MINTTLQTTILYVILDIYVYMGEDTQKKWKTAHRNYVARHTLWFGVCFYSSSLKNEQKLYNKYNKNNNKWRQRITTTIRLKWNRNWTRNIHRETISSSSSSTKKTELVAVGSARILMWLVNLYIAFVLTVSCGIVKICIYIERDRQRENIWENRFIKCFVSVLLTRLFSLAIFYRLFRLPVSIYITHKRTKRFNANTTIKKIYYPHLRKGISLKCNHPQTHTDSFASHSILIVHTQAK